MVDTEPDLELARAESYGLESSGSGWGPVLTVVGGSEFHGWDVPGGAAQAVVRAHPLEGGDRDLLDRPPRRSLPDQLGLEQADRRLRERVAGAKPASTSRSVNAIEVYCADSTGRSNTVSLERGRLVVEGPAGVFHRTLVFSFVPRCLGLDGSTRRGSGNLSSPVLLAEHSSRQRRSLA
jgi:hypothetical protein